MKQPKFKLGDVVIWTAEEGRQKIIVEAWYIGEWRKEGSWVYAISDTFIHKEDPTIFKGVLESRLEHVYVEKKE